MGNFLLEGKHSVIDRIEFSGPTESRVLKFETSLSDAYADPVADTLTRPNENVAVRPNTAGQLNVVTVRFFEKCSHSPA